MPSYEWVPAKAADGIAGQRLGWEESGCCGDGHSAREVTGHRARRPPTEGFGAEEENTGRKIIIENQLERTDHTHLGQLITYAAGLEAGFIIWIVREAREELQQAVDWLNEHTGEDINFFLVLIELWRIGDSLPAPKFTAICRPNEWTRIVRTTEIGATQKKQLDFWQRLKEYAAGARPELKLRTPRPQHWFDVAIGRTDCHVSLSVDSQEDEVRCDLYIRDSKELYKALLANRDRIERELGVPLEWLELPNKKASRIRALHAFDFSDESTWDGTFAWLTETTSKFKRVFAKDWTAPSGQRTAAVDRAPEP